MKSLLHKYLCRGQRVIQQVINLPSTSPILHEHYFLGMKYINCMPTNDTNINIWWIRRDIRLADNQALSRAINAAEQVIPLFILDPALLQSEYSSEKRLAFLFAGLRALDEDLRKRGSSLILRSGNPLHVLSELMEELQAAGIYAEKDYSPYARKRDDAVAQSLPLHLLPGLTVHAPDAVVKADGTPYTIFTPFSKAWKDQPVMGKLLLAPEHISTPTGLKSETIPLNSTSVLFPAGEKTAHSLLNRFTADGISSYAEARNRMDLEGTSGLSPYLRFGMLSARQALDAARRAEAQAVNANSRRGAETWLNELIWREFYVAVLLHFPFVRKTAFRANMRNIPWLNTEEDFQEWSAGRTGYPVVDAAMRQMLATGWMHNRARMITASFLTKDLLIDWRRGEKFFMQHLVDGDPAANNGGWQWSAGTGTDAAPYFRVFNPVLQGLKFDPHGAYVRRWVPELESVPDAYIHAPWEMPDEVARKLGFVPGKTYLEPIVDHGFARQRVLLAYKQ